MIDPGAVERNCRRLASELSEGTELCAVVKADGYGHGAVPCAAAALAGGATWLAVAAAAEAVELRAELAERARLLVLGALDPRASSTWRSAPAPTSPSGAAASSSCAEARGRELGIRPQVHVKYDTGMGRLGERDPDAGRRARSLGGRLAGPRPGRDLDPLRDRGRARPLILRPASSSASASWRCRCATSSAARSCTPRTAPRRCASPAPTSTWSAAGSRSTASTRSASDPAEQGLEPALDAALLRRRREALRARRQRRLRAHLDRAPSRPGSGCCRSATATASGAALSNNAEVLVGGRRHPVVGHDLDGQPDRRPRARAAGRGRARRRS